MITLFDIALYVWGDSSKAYVLAEKFDIPLSRQFDDLSLFKIPEETFLVSCPATGVAVQEGGIGRGLTIGKYVIR